MGDEQLRALERRFRAEGHVLPADFRKRYGRKLLDIKIPGDPTSLKAMGYNIQGDYRSFFESTAPAPYFAKLLSEPVRMFTFQEYASRRVKRLWRCYHVHKTAKAAWRCCRREAYKREVLKMLANTDGRGHLAPQRGVI